MFESLQTVNFFIEVFKNLNNKTKKLFMKSLKFTEKLFPRTAVDDCLRYLQNI